MQLAIGEARAAAARGEIPVGAIVVVADRVVGRGPRRGFSVLTNSTPFHPKAEVVWDVRADECRELIVNFFKSRRP